MRSLPLLRLLLAVLCVLSAASSYAADVMPADEGGGPDVEDAPTATPEKAKPVKPAAEEPAPTPIPDENVRTEYDTVILQGLDKVTGRISKFSAIVGKPEKFGNLQIIARRCWQASPEERPENAALLEINEVKAGEKPISVFTGWMFSSSPGLSAIEHPVYDITVLSCAAQPSSKPKPTPTPAPAAAAKKAPAKAKAAKAPAPKAAH